MNRSWCVIVVSQSLHFLLFIGFARLRLQINFSKLIVSSDANMILIYYVERISPAYVV